VFLIEITFLIEIAMKTAALESHLMSVALFLQVFGSFSLPPAFFRRT